MRPLPLRSSLMLALAVFLAAPHTAVPQVPLKTNYQVMLTDDADEPLADQTVELVFRIYDADSEFGSLLWTETHNATTNSIGVVSVVLGETNPLNFGFDGPTWLQIDVDGETLTPRRELVSSPYAIRAAVADSVTGISGDGDWTVAGDDMHAAVTGNVGIGTDSPAEKLDVVGTIQTESFRMAGGATPGFVLTTDAEGLGTWQPGGSGGVDGDWSVSGRHMYSAVPGSLGVGTTTQRARLNVDGGNGNAIYCEVSDGAAITTRHLGGGGGGYVSTNDYGLYGLHPDGIAIYGQSDTLAVLGYNQYRNQTGGLGGEEWGAYGKHTGGSEGYLGAGIIPGSVGVKGEHPSGNFGYLGYQNFGAYGENEATGNYGGLGSAGAGAWGYSDDDYGVYAFTHTGTGVYSTSMSGVAVQGSRGSNYGYLGGSDYGVKGEGPSKGVHGFSSSGYGVYGASESGRAGMFNGDVEVMAGSRIITPVIEITAGSDLSERFAIRAAGVRPEPGMLVCVDAENPGGLVVSSRNYDRRVAGIVSGAGGIAPGMLMGQRGSAADGEVPVALSGRVYCLCDASFGPIEPGDLLTTSDTPGHAMKATDRDRSPGAIVGKAMTVLDEGRGLVLVLVNLQ